METTRFGKIEVEDQEMINLPQGLVGFPELKKYILLNHDQESPFKWLQSLDDGAIAFVIINPLLFRPDYAVEVSESEISELEIKSEEDAVISVIVTMPSNPQNMTANLKAPLVFNLQNRRGKQIILSNSSYATKHNIMDELKEFTKKQQQQQQQQQVENTKASIKAAPSETTAESKA
ncbi:MAG: flagellar assembly protein FliW [Zetaproteobacteria bacterium]|nr:flagellar assembly protein FliW [Zetaproteobacteria bacterium]